MASMASPVPPSALKRANQKTPRAGKNVVFADDKTAAGGSPDGSPGGRKSSVGASVDDVQAAYLAEARATKKREQSRAEVAKLKRWRAQRRVLLKDPGYQHFAAKCYKLHFDRWAAFSKYSVDVKWLIYYAWEDYAFNKKKAAFKKFKESVLSTGVRCEYKIIWTTDHTNGGMRSPRRVLFVDGKPSALLDTPGRSARTAAPAHRRIMLKKSHTFNGYWRTKDEELSQLTIERKRAADAAKEAKRAKKKGGLPLLDLDGVKGSGSSDGDSSSMFILRGGTSTATSGSTDDDSSSAFVLR